MNIYLILICVDCWHIYIPHCVPGQQQCGGSPDNIMCTQCEDPYYSGGYGNGCQGTCTHFVNGQTMLPRTKHYVRKAPVKPNGDATAFVQRSQNLSARCAVAAKYA